LQRGRPESRFGRILANLLDAHDAIESATFVADDGECIDYASRIDPFEAEVRGAQMLAVTGEIAARAARVGAGALLLWNVEAERRDFVIRRVTEEHWLVLALKAPGVTAQLLRALGAVADALRREAGFAEPAWDARGEPLGVTVRPSLGFGFAPDAIRLDEGPPSAVEVLGRWLERGLLSSEEVVCFRVRCEGRELTLAYDRQRGAWYRR
jgi:predicted regulator of Ras-like GTPase activity (Roadblock/LC7/MglB family)